MADVDLTLGNTVTRMVSEKGLHQFVHLSRTRDFSVAANSVSNADVLQMINIPAGMLVLGAYVKTTTAETSTAQLGDGSDVNGWLGTSQCNLNSTATNVPVPTVEASVGGTVTIQSPYAAQGGKFYPVADTLDLIPTATLNSAKVRVGCWGFMLLPPDVDPV
jgi:hypothetical protein